MRAVARGEDRYEALVLHSTDIAVVFDSEGTIVYVTPSMEAMTSRPTSRP
jgi:PAS domain S-box-containing protein